MANKVEIQVAVAGAQAAQQQLAALNSGSSAAGSLSSPAAAAATTTAANATAAATRNVASAAQAATTSGNAAAAAVSGVGQAARAAQPNVVGLAARLAGFGEAGEMVNRLAMQFPKLAAGITSAAGALAAFGVGWKVGQWVGDVTGLSAHLTEAYENLAFGGKQTVDNSVGDRAKKQRLAIEGTKDWTKEDSAEDVVTKRWREQAGKDWRKEGGLADKIAAKDPETMARYKAEVQAENERRELEKQQAARANVTPAQRDAMMNDLQKRMDAEFVKGGNSEEYQRLSGLKDDAQSGKLAEKYYGKNFAEQVSLEDARTQAEADKLKEMDGELAAFFGSVAEGAKKLSEIKDDLEWDAKVAVAKGDQAGADRLAVEQQALSDGTLSTLGGGDPAKGLSRFREMDEAVRQGDAKVADEIRRPSSMVQGSQEAFSAQLGPFRQDEIRATQENTRSLRDLKEAIDRLSQGGGFVVVGEAA